MSPAGRPFSKNPLSVDLKVRIDKNTSERLDAYCMENCVNRAEAIRRGIHLLLATEKEK